MVDYKVLREIKKENHILKETFPVLEKDKSTLKSKSKDPEKKILS